MFDPTKPVQTRDGRKARIICTDENSHRPIIAIIETKHKEEWPAGYLSDGRVWHLDDTEDDLINIEEGGGELE